MKKSNKYILVNGASYHAETVAGYKSFEDFKAEMDTQAKAVAKEGNETIHYGAWGDQRDALLQQVYDKAQAHVAEAAKTVATDAPPPPQIDNNPEGTAPVAATAGKPRK